jgi:hypothetical protein
MSEDLSSIECAGCHRRAELKYLFGGWWALPVGWWERPRPSPLGHLYVCSRECAHQNDQEEDMRRLKSGGSGAR